MTKAEVERPPLVSIVTPTFNSSKYLEQLLVSVETQSYSQIEHIVIDDGSTDGGQTQALLRRHPNVRWWSRENRGQYATVNEGFMAAKGELGTTISADDFYADPRAVADVVNHYIAHNDCDVVHGDTLHVDSDGSPLPVQPYQDYPLWMIPYNPGFISHCSLFVRRYRIVADGILFDESLRFTGDGDWMIRLYLAGYRHCRVRRLVGAYRHHTQQVSTVASRDPASAEARRTERSAVDRRYIRSRLLKRMVNAYVTYRRRTAKALWASRTGGISAVGTLVCAWWGGRRRPA